MLQADWLKRYSRKLFATDIAIIVLTLATSQTARFSIAVQEMGITALEVPEFWFQYTLLSIGLGVVWLAALGVLDTRAPKIIGFGPDEYRLVFQATVTPFAIFAILAFSIQMEFGRGYLFLALPMGVVLMLLTRYLWRKRLHYKRQRGLNAYVTLVVGNAAKVKHIAQQLTVRPHLGFDLVGAVITSDLKDARALPVPVLGGLDDVLEAVDEHRAQVLVLTDTDALSPQRIRELGWELESRGVMLIVATALTDIAGPRLHTRPVSGLPLTFVDFPEFTRSKRFIKRIFDLITSSLLIVVLSPVFLILALVVKFSSPGNVFFSQERVGIHGQRFVMWKFRSMVPDAEQRLDELAAQNQNLLNSSPNTVLFKMRDDPRMTAVGRIMRRYSLDELPQLFNVLKGEMSLVGPRPPLEREVAQYGVWDHRRLFVRPGITGLWQTSGRNKLTWEESIRLDLYYVENWSFMGDLLLLAKTLKAVVKSEGS